MNKNDIEALNEAYDQIIEEKKNPYHKGITPKEAKWKRYLSKAREEALARDQAKTKTKEKTPVKEAAIIPPQGVEGEGIEERDPSMYGMEKNFGAQQPLTFEHDKWLKIFKNELGIGPRDHAAEEAIYRSLDEPIKANFNVSIVKGTKNPGITIRFDDGTHGPAFFVTKNSTVMQVLAATYKKYPDVFEKIAEQIVGASGDEYEGM